MSLPGCRAAVAALAGLALLTGCASSAGAGESAIPSASGPAVASPSDASPSLAAAPPSGGVEALGAAPTPSAKRSAAPKKAAAAGCPRDSGLAQIWASWPMPNPEGTALPNPASYTDLGDGTVRDEVTCLIWQRQPAAGGYTWSAARSYCASLELAGGGWHLPSRVELTSLVDTTRSGPAINTTAFPGTPVAFFWTSSPWTVSHSPAYSWIINFFEGLASNAADQAGEFRVRCVRSPGGSGEPAYDIAEGEVGDSHTGLSWQRASSPATMSAAAATDYCADLDLGGHAWRLPSVQELATLVDETRVAPAINLTAFPDTAKSTWYWSASTAAPDTTKRWGLNYDDGFTNYRSISAGFARCVR